MSSKIKYTYKYKEEILEETYDIPLNLTTPMPINKNDIDYIVTSIGVNAKTSDHTIYLTELSEYNACKTKQEVKVTPIKVIHKEEAPKDTHLKYVQYRKRIEDGRWSNWLVVKKVPAFEAQTVLDDVQTNGNRTYQYRIMPEPKSKDTPKDLEIEEVSEVKKEEIEIDEYKFEIQYKERDNVTKILGEWKTLKKFLTDVERNGYFKAMNKENNRVYKIKG